MTQTKNKATSILGSAVLLLFAFIHLSPIYIMLVNAFKDRSELYENALALPKTMSMQYFGKAFEKMNFLQALKNSFVITIVATLLIVLLSSMTAWMLVRSDTKFSRFIFMLFVATMLIPFQTVMMPLMQFMGFLQDTFHLQLLNSQWGLIFMYIGFGSAMSVFLFHGFIKSIPVSLEEAAVLDGASKWGVYWRVVFPMLRPITVTVIILNVIWIWNDYLLPSLVISNKDLRTIPLSTASFFGQFTIQWNLAMAGLTMTIIPVIIFYALAQKYIIKGVAEGAVK